ncbi:hypothetical protein ABZX85_38380 [Streptomyces sp. NPDC004539]|uniref:nSTAND1 domain-containing NTPase n=1 Tax=Streptomyces sp. NPDC004539 TaxID=3154280 RepID=UPI0033BE97F0
MGRREKPLDPEAGPVQRLAHELRGLREAAGKPTYQDMARRAKYSTSALSAAAGGEQLPSLPVVLAYVQALGAQSEAWEERWREAKGAVEERAREEAAGIAEPYRGLARFESCDRDLYFGRDALVGELLGLVRAHRFVAVSGPSGSGKSSLLRAGLIPALRDATGADRPEVIRVLTPGERPAATHEKALMPQEGELDTWVVVDQFEEVFTLCRDAEERDRFLRLLLTSRDLGSRLRVVVAVRGDFHGRCARDRELAEAIGRACLLVGPMDRDELREVVTKPAAAVGLLVERALTARIVDEFTGRPGALPLLSHTLLETWRRRRGRTLTTAAYEAAGGVGGAIAATAEEMYGALPTDRTRTARRVLLRLIAPGQGTADARGPVEHTEFPADARDVLERLAVARLVTLDDGVVELAHSAVITGWPRLAAWIEEDRERLHEQRRLTEAARAWEELGREDGALYRGSRLSRAEELFTGEPEGPGVRERPGDEDDLTHRERAFLTASLTARDTAELRRRTLSAVLCVLLVLALTVGLVAWQQNRAGQAEAAEATARRIAASAAGLRSSDPRTAMLLGAAAWRTAPLVESRSALLGALYQAQRDTFTDPQTGSDTRRFLIDQARRLVSVAGGTVSVWDVARRHRSAFYRLPADTEVGAVSPDGRFLDLTGPDGTGQLWDLTAGKPVAGMGDGSVLAFTSDGSGRLTTPLDRTGPVELRRTTDGEVLLATTADPTAAGLDHDGRLLALCPAGGSPEVWDTVRDERLPGGWARDKDFCGTGTGADGGGHVLRFSPDGTRLAAVSGTTARVWDVSRGALVAELGSLGTTGFTDLDFTPDNRFLATADDGELTVWRLLGSGLPVVRVPLAQGQEVRDLTWALGRDRVLSFRDAATVRSYDLTPNLAAPWQETPADASVLSPDGTALVTATRSGGTYRLELRSAHTGALLAHDTVGALPTSVDETPLLAFSPDGRALVVSGISPLSGRQRVMVWDVASHTARTSFELPGTRENPAYPLALGPDGRTLLIGGTTGTDIRDTGTGRRTGALPGLFGETFAVRPDGRLLVGSLDRYARLPNGTAVGRALADGKKVTALAFSSDGERLAVGDASGRVTLWDGNAERRTDVLAGLSGAAGEGAPEEVAALAFSADGRTLAVGGTHGTLRLWDTASQQLLGTDLPTSGDEIRSAAFGRDDGTLYTTGPHTTLQRYTVDAERAAAAVCERAGGSLSEARWRTYVPDTPYREVC